MHPLYAPGEGPASGITCDLDRFEPAQPSGRLHRAFSVFLFDHENRLLLQQRAHSKITFPGVWTNTCCSHPLFGYDPTEVDTPEDVAAGRAPGTVRVRRQYRAPLALLFHSLLSSPHAPQAALRKLDHELGIRPSSLDPAAFRFLTRLHYCAADQDPSSGASTGWGEHEMDYILLVRAAVQCQPNPEEVAEVKYVTLEELRAMMDPASGLRWSPWFRIIAERFLEPWWRDLDAALTTSKHVDATGIYKVM